LALSIAFEMSDWDFFAIKQKSPKLFFRGL
jgi:hypothetical protein